MYGLSKAIQIGRDLAHGLRNLIHGARLCRRGDGKSKKSNKKKAEVKVSVIMITGFSVLNFSLVLSCGYSNHV